MKMKPATQTFMVVFKFHVIEFMQNETYCREQEVSMLVTAHFVTETNSSHMLWFTISQNSMDMNQKQGYCTLNKIHK